MPAGEVDLLRITAGSSTVGYLYNFIHRGRVYAYQSGFDYAGAGAHEKPGLTCHRLAIEHYLSEGMDSYDFLAGEDRYKASLANTSTDLHWVEHFSGLSLPRLGAWVRGRLERIRSRGQAMLSSG
jgi:CelD/BcsL family acetyltransferase involved in cellulose biosynthesis